MKEWGGDSFPLSFPRSFSAGEQPQCDPAARNEVPKRTPGAGVTAEIPSLPGVFFALRDFYSCATLIASRDSENPADIMAAIARNFSGLGPHR